MEVLCRCPHRPETSDLPGSGITGPCEPPWGCWESNSVALQDLYMCLTAEPTPQLPIFSFLIKISKLGVVVHTWDPCTAVAEVGISDVQGHP